MAGHPVCTTVALCVVPVLENPGCTIFNVTDSHFFPKFLEILDTNWNFINVGYNSVIVGQNLIIWL